MPSASSLTIPTWATIALLAAAAGPTQDAFAQAADSTQDHRIFGRWVGAKEGSSLPIWLDFFGDSMLVISDIGGEHPTDYALAPQTLTVFGGPRVFELLAVAFNRGRDGEDFTSQTSFEIRYRFSLDRLLLTADGRTITMTAQSVLARRIEVTWIADLPDGTLIELTMDRAGNVGHRIAPGGSWVWGEWERDARDITFDWTPDSLEAPDSTMIWHGVYDPDGQKILLEDIGEGTATTIFRRIIR